MKAVCVFSGGLDSTVLLYELAAKGYKVFPLAFYYGQQNEIELRYAERTASKLGYPLRIFNVKEAFGFKAVPVGTDGMDSKRVKETADVPNRNMMMLSIAGAYAVRESVKEIFCGITGPIKGYTPGFPDVTEPFVKAMQQSLKLCEWEPLLLRVPFMKISKVGVIKRGFRLNVPFEKTWTCYYGASSMRQPQCGKCSSCVSRLEAFWLAKKEDPAVYADRKYWKTRVEL